MKSKRFFLVLPALAALVAGVWLAQSRHAAHDAPAATLWQLDFPDLAGQRQPLARWHGRVLVLNFWASWCAPCREEIPDFVALHREFAPRGVEFVGIAIDSPDQVRQFLQTVPVSYPILVGEGAAHNLARQLGNASGALPYTIVLDRDGKVVLTRLGRLPRATLEAVLRRYGA
jgi:thiol-disulfide isomerase/thioredoxin